MSSRPTLHDVLVVGGGPAGLAVALGAARAGMDVVLCERRAGTVDKACGEGLMPGALLALQALGVDPPGGDIRGITYRQGATVAQARFRGAPGRGVRRTGLHDALRAAVDAAGVAVLDRRVTSVTQDESSVRADGLRARYLVAADGLHSPIRAAVGLDRRPRGTPRWGLRQHFAIAPPSDSVEVTWAADSEAYVTPVGPSLVGVAVLSSTRAGFREQLRAFPAIESWLSGAPAASDVRGAGPLRQRTGGQVAGRVLLAGDAAGYVDALTGEGLALAFSTAAALVRCLADGRPERYGHEWARGSRRSRWLTSGLLAARTNPVTASRVVPLAAHAPRLFSAAVNQLAS